MIEKINPKHIQHVSSPNKASFYKVWTSVFSPLLAKRLRPQVQHPSEVIPMLCGEEQWQYVVGFWQEFQ